MASIGITRWFRSQRGFALIIVLWVLILMTLMAASFSAGTRTSANLSRNFRDSAQAEALADAGVYRAVATLIGREETLLANQADARFKLSPPADTSGVDVSGTEMVTWRYANAEIRYTVADESGKVDINMAPAPLLRELLVELGLDGRAAEQAVDAIIDYRDSDHEARPGGHEDSDYDASGREGSAKDAPYTIVEELLQVKGVSPAIYALIAPYLTTFTGATSPNAAMAPPPVLAALDRMQSNRTPAQEQADRARANIVDEGNDDEQGNQNQEENADASVFRVHAEARLPGGAVFSRDAVVRILGDLPNGYAILYWRQGDRRLFPLR